MKKIFGIALALAVLATLALGSVALADDPDNLNVSWDGSGHVWGDINTGDAYAGFDTAGSYISGSYTANETENTTYPYMGVDNFNAHLNAYVENGHIGTGCNRLDSYESMYGNAGQSSYSYVYVEDGSASMAYRTTTNYAQMRDCSYTYQLPGGHNIVTSAAYYYMDRYIDDNRGESGQLLAWGSGTATMDCMNAEASGCWELKLGRGCGCYTDANYSATGSGHFEVTGTGSNGAAFYAFPLSASGDGTPHSASVQIIANFATSFSIADYSVHGW